MKLSGSGHCLLYSRISHCVRLVAHVPGVMKLSDSEHCLIYSRISHCVRLVAHVQDIVQYTHVYHIESDL